MIDQRLDISDLQDPDKLNKLVERFTVMWDATENVTSDPVLTLFDNSQSASIDIDLIMTLNTLKHGGV
jgi:hypothetical protein